MPHSFNYGAIADQYYQAKLKQMGTPLQEALSQFARNALRCAVSESNRGGGGSIIDVVDRWKASSNGHLSDLEQILYQYGGVQEPADSIASKPVKNESVQLSSHELQVGNPSDIDPLPDSS